MKHKQIIAPANLRLIIVAVCILLLLMFTRSQAFPLKIDEIKIEQTATHQISIQVRTNDGRTAKMELYNEGGELVKSIQVIHSKINYVSNLKYGTYIYRCISSDGDERKGKFSIK